jgi:hypothetical protein
MLRYGTPLRDASRSVAPGGLQVSAEKQVQLTPSHSISRICTGTGRLVMTPVRAAQDVVADLGRDRFCRAASYLCCGRRQSHPYSTGRVLYSWTSPPSRSCRWICRCVILAGPVIVRAADLAAGRSRHPDGDGDGCRAVRTRLGRAADAPASRSTSGRAVRSGGPRSTAA